MRADWKYVSHGYWHGQYHVLVPRYHVVAVHGHRKGCKTSQSQAHRQRVPEEEALVHDVGDGEDPNDHGVADDDNDLLAEDVSGLRQVAVSLSEAQGGMGERVKDEAGLTKETS